MDNSTPPANQPNPDLLKLSINPFTKTFIVWDVCNAYITDENQVNAFLQMGFEPYAVTLVPETRPDVIAKARLAGGMAMNQIQWFKRPRELPQSEEFVSK